MEIGDKVKVVDGFEAYTNYSAFVKDNIPMLTNFYENGNVPKADNIVYEIIARWSLKGGNKFIYGIYNNKHKELYIIGDNGLKLVDKESNKKYVILDTGSGELIIEDNNPYFMSLEDAKNYVLECEENPQLLNILEVLKVFECEVNFKPKALCE